MQINVAETSYLNSVEINVNDEVTADVWLWDVQQSSCGFFGIAQGSPWI
jgi:hypothetical protein